MAHRNPSGDLALIVESALDLLLAALLKQRCGKTQRSVSRDGCSERVTAATKRVVSERDSYRCSYVDANGQRCESRAFLEYDHVVPAGKGGSSRPDNVRLMCRAHNRLAAELVYGREKIEAEIAKRRRRRQETSKRLSVRDCRLAATWAAKQRDDAAESLKRGDAAESRRLDCSATQKSRRLISPEITFKRTGRRCT
jgi:hypothetical protein